MKCFSPLLETEGTVSQNGALSSFNVDNTLKYVWTNSLKYLVISVLISIGGNLPFGWMTFGGCSFGVPGVLTNGVVLGEFEEGDYKNKKIQSKVL